MGQNGTSTDAYMAIWGPSCQLDNQYKNPNINNRDHLVSDSYQETKMKYKKLFE